MPTRLMATWNCNSRSSGIPNITPSVAAKIARAPAGTPHQTGITSLAGPHSRDKSGLEEFQQVGVDLVLLGRAHAVRAARIDLELGVLDDLRGDRRRGLERHDLVVVAVQ